MTSLHTCPSFCPCPREEEGKGQFSCNRGLLCTKVNLRVNDYFLSHTLDKAINWSKVFLNGFNLLPGFFSLALPPATLWPYLHRMQENRGHGKSTNRLTPNPRSSSSSGAKKLSRRGVSKRKYWFIVAALKGDPHNVSSRHFYLWFDAEEPPTKDMCIDNEGKKKLSLPQAPLLTLRQVNWSLSLIPKALLSGRGCVPWFPKWGIFTYHSSM